MLRGSFLPPAPAPAPAPPRPASVTLSLEPVVVAAPPPPPPPAEPAHEPLDPLLQDYNRLALQLHTQQEAARATRSDMQALAPRLLAALDAQARSEHALSDRSRLCVVEQRTYGALNERYLNAQLAQLLPDAEQAARVGAALLDNRAVRCRRVLRVRRQRGAPPGPRAQARARLPSAPGAAA